MSFADYNVETPSTIPQRNVTMGTLILGMDVQQLALLNQGTHVLDFLQLVLLYQFVRMVL